jgi:HAD superfamily phosphoserine phosphatase-like hydrolase
MRIAFLDLDHTLLAADSNQLWMAFLRSEQLISEEQFFVHDQFLRDYARGALNFPALQAFRIGLDASIEAASLQSVRAVFEREVLIPAIAPLAPRLLAELAQRGLTTVLVSATRSPLVDPVAQALGVEHAITSCFGHDKVMHVQAWLKRWGSSLTDLQRLTAAGCGDAPCGG